MANKVKFKLKKESLSDFTSKLEDLCKIDDTIKLKIDQNDVLMYSMMGGSVLLAFKNYVIKTEDLFQNSDFDYKLDIVIPNCKKFVKNLSFLSTDNDINFDINFKESPDDEELYLARSFQITSGKFKVNWLGGEQYEMRDIDKVSLNQRLDLRNKKWSFSINNKDFLDIKKLSTINSERILNISVIKGEVTISEKSAWELEIDKIEDDRNTNLILNKRFLTCINDTPIIDINIFDTFMLIKDDSSNLMLSFEQSFEDD
jgi:hypothetical protein